MYNTLKKPNWQLKIFISLGTAAIIVVGLIIINKFFLIHRVSLQDIHWTQAPNLFAIQDVKRLNHNGILFIRPQDGKEQFLAGNWNVNFTIVGAYVFGEFPKGYSSQTGQQIYFVSANLIHDIELDDLTSNISAIHEDSSGTYVFIESNNNDNTQYCIVKQILAKSSVCQQLNINKNARAKWNPRQKYELALKTENNEFYAYDTQKNKMNLINPDDKPEQYQQFNSLFTDSVEPRKLALANQEYNFWRFLNIIFIKKADKWSLHRVPIKTKKIAWFDDGEHLLIVEHDRISILELSTNNLATAIEEKNIGEKPIIIRHNNYDIAL